MKIRQRKVRVQKSKRYSCFIKAVTRVREINRMLNAIYLDPMQKWVSENVNKIYITNFPNLDNVDVHSSSFLESIRKRLSVVSAV